MTSKAFRNVQTLNGLFVDVRTFGAKGDNIADDLPALNAACQSVYDAGGGTIYLPAGYYRVTDQWVIGRQAFTNFSFLTNRTGVVGDAIFSANTDPVAEIFNQSKPGAGISIEFESGAYLVADFTPAIPTPVLGYYFLGNYRERGVIRNPAIISSQMVVNNEYNFNGITTPNGATNNLIGLVVRVGLAAVENPHIGGCEHGIIAAAPYWTKITNARFERIGGIALNIAQGNAFSLSNCVIWESNKGIVFDGDASSLTGLHTEEVAQDLIVYRADACLIGPGYFEDTKTSSAPGTYAISLGTTENGNEVVHTSFRGLRVGSTRSGKGAYRVWSTRNSEIKLCRAYSKPAIADAQSTGLFFENDFTLVGATKSKWVIANPTISQPSFNLSGTQRIVQGPWFFNLAGVSVGSINADSSANYDFNLPAAFDNLFSVGAFATYGSGGSPLLTLTTRFISGTPRQIRITFYNPTATPINPGTMTILLYVFAGEP